MSGHTAHAHGVAPQHAHHAPPSTATPPPPLAELLKDNLYEFQKYLADAGEAPYFTLCRVQRVAKQVLHALAFLHGIGLVHSDLKPENILVKSYSKCEIKVRGAHRARPLRCATAARK